MTLTGLDGTSLGSLAVPNAWNGIAPSTGGPGGVYVVANGRVVELTTQGRTVDLGSAGNLDTAAAGSGFVVSPDGRRWAWGSSEVSAAIAEQITNRLWVAGIGEAPHIIAERAFNRLATPAADTPGPEWQFRVLDWVAQGIVINRELIGICGCDWFEEGYNRNTALVDPSTGIATDVSNDRSISLSSVAVDGTAVLLHSSAGTTAVDEIRLERNGVATGTVTLSGQNAAGAALFNPAGQAVAYATVPTSVLVSSDWVHAGLASTMRIVDLTTGAGHAVGAPGLRPLAWMPDGSVLALSILKTGDTLTDSAVEVSTAGSIRTILDTGTSASFRLVTAP